MKRLLSGLAALVCACGTALAQPQTPPPPIGYINHVAYDNGDWTVTGWACEAGTNTALSVDLYVNNSFVVRGYTTEAAEQPVHNACQTWPSTPHRFKVSYSGPTNGQPIRVMATGTTGLTTDLGGSNLAGLPPSPHPLAVMEAYSRILVYTAHPDDELLFAARLGPLCHPSGGRTCTIVVATQGEAGNNSGVPQARVDEMKASARRFPLAVDQGPLSDMDSNSRTVAQVLANWNSEVAPAHGNLAGLFQAHVNLYQPQVILTFDPRTGTSCHSEHRAIGKAVHAAVEQGHTGFPMDRLFFLTTRRYGDTAPLPPNAPYDRSSVVYSSNNQFYTHATTTTTATWMTGWEFTRDLLHHHETQFGAPGSVKLQGYLDAADAVHELDRNTAFQSAAHYRPYDPLHYDCEPDPPAYKLVPHHTSGGSPEKCLDVTGGPSAIGNHAGLQQWDCQNPPTRNQVFHAAPTGVAGEIQLVPMHSGKCLDIVNGSTGDGAGVQQYSCSVPDVAHQRLRFVATGTPGVFEVRTHANKCLDVQGGPGQFANGAPIQQYQCLGGQNQQWKLVPVQFSAGGDPMP